MEYKVQVSPEADYPFPSREPVWRKGNKQHLHYKFVLSDNTERERERRRLRCKTYKQTCLTGSRRAPAAAQGLIRRQRAQLGLSEWAPPKSSPELTMFGNFRWKKPNALIWMSRKDALRECLALRLAFANLISAFLFISNWKANGIDRSAAFQGGGSFSVMREKRIPEGPFLFFFFLSCPAGESKYENIALLVCHNWKYK